MTYARGFKRNANVGYVLFAFGALWLMTIAAIMAAAPAAPPECQQTGPGDTAICATPATAPAAAVAAARSSGKGSRLAAPGGRSRSGFETF
jgi:peptidoglycan/LPS O-acetylase OafA/YrhL